MKLRPSTDTMNQVEALSPEQPHGCRCIPTQDADAEWRSFCSVLADAIDCAVDLAIVHGADDPDDVAALQHLRTIALARLAGVPAELRLGEMLRTRCMSRVLPALPSAWADGA